MATTTSAYPYYDTVVAALQRDIDAAFAGVRLGDGVTLGEWWYLLRGCGRVPPELADAAAEARATEEKDDWRKVALRGGNARVHAVGGLDDAAWRYYLPAVLHAFLTCGAFHETPTGRAFQWVLEHGSWRFGLTPAQAACVEAFLTLVRRLGSVDVAADPDEDPPHALCVHFAQWRTLLSERA